MMPPMPQACKTTLALGVILLASCASTGESAIKGKKTALVITAMSDKLAAAKTLRFEATRSASPSLFGGLDAPGHSRLSGVLKRPGSLKIEEQTREGRRTLIYDGREIVLIDHRAGNHARVAASPTLDAATYWVASRYGFKPPLAEVLVNNPATFMLDGVTRASFVGTEMVQGINCDHLTFRQPGVKWDLWVSVADSLPRQIIHSYPPYGRRGARTVSTAIHRWRLDPSVPASTFKIGLPEGSQRVELSPPKP